MTVVLIIRRTPLVPSQAVRDYSILVYPFLVYPRHATPNNIFYLLL